METFLHILKFIGLILIVIFSFNVIIFVHELGHFLAARWRGLVVDRFQIWFGKPIWKKTINGVQYGLGSIPAGGFVSLPQMAPMESIEGEHGEDKEKLPPIKPIDKIIVAFAGPLFSLLLALAAACVVAKVGKPSGYIDTNVIGYVLDDMPAAKAGIQPGDKITKIDGETVTGFQGTLDSIMESIIFSKGDSVKLTIERPGVGEMEITCGFEVEEGGILKRDGVRQIGVYPADDAVIGSVFKGGPAEYSGLQAGDKVLSIDGVEIHSWVGFVSLIHEKGTEPFTVKVQRGNEELEIRTMALVPSNGYKANPTKDPVPMIGIGPKGADKSHELIYPSPWDQIYDSSRMLFVTIDRLAAPKSGIKFEHLSGPIGIGKMKYQILLGDYPVRMILYFWVIFNVNLAIFNMLPFPILDGGHITMALSEMIFKKPMNEKILLVMQNTFLTVLLTLFVFISMKDTFTGMGGPKVKREGPVEPEFDVTPLKALKEGASN